MKTGNMAGRYRDAGVDLAKGDEAKRAIAELVRSTHGPEVAAGVGSFAGLWRLPGGSGTLLAATIDGVGTKIKIAQAVGRHRTIGIDIVNHCVNDLLAAGALPAFFLDYFAAGALDPNALREIVEGMAEACRESGCAILGGETAEMPGVYARGEYDVAGCMIGLAQEAKLPGAARVRPGMKLVGLAASGLHTNGFSLVRRVLLEEAKLPLDGIRPELGMTLAEALLTPHRGYRSLLGPALEAGRLPALAHVTGGGIPGNLNRVLPPDVDALIHSASWIEPAVFDLIRRTGRIEEAEMRSVFNLGVGMIVVSEAEEAEPFRAGIEAGGCQAWIIGATVPGSGRVVFQEAT